MLKLLNELARNGRGVEGGGGGLGLLFLDSGVIVLSSPKYNDFGKSISWMEFGQVALSKTNFTLPH